MAARGLAVYSTHAGLSAKQGECQWWTVGFCMNSQRPSLRPCEVSRATMGLCEQGHWHRSKLRFLRGLRSLRTQAPRMRGRCKRTFMHAVAAASESAEHVFSSICPPVTHIAQRLEQWLVAGGALGLERCSIRRGQHGGYGLYALSTFGAGETVLWVPASLHLRIGGVGGRRVASQGTSALSTLAGAGVFFETALADLASAGCYSEPEGEQVTNDEGQDCGSLLADQALLALALAHEELLGAQSFFAPYIDSLPQELNVSLDASWLWTPSARTELLPAKLGAEADEISACVECEYTALLGTCDRFVTAAGAISVVAAAAAAALRGPAGRRRWRWARPTVFARSFQLGQVVALVPGCDAANHSEGKSLGILDDYPRDDSSRGGNKCGATVLSEQSLEPNDEVCISYGPSLSNGELLLKYGFVVPSRKVDEWEALIDIAYSGEFVERLEFTLPVGPLGECAPGLTAAEDSKEWYRHWSREKLRQDPEHGDDFDEVYDDWGVPRFLLELAREETLASEQHPEQVTSEMLEWLLDFCDGALEAAESQAMSASRYSGCSVDIQGDTDAGLESEGQKDACQKRRLKISTDVMAMEIAAFQRLRGSIMERIGQ